MGESAMENKGTGNRNQINGENAAAVSYKLKAAKRKGATKGALISGFVGLAVLITAIVVAHSNMTKERTVQMALMETQKTAFTRQVTERDSIINDWLLTFDQIEKDMNLIKQKENILTVKSTESEFSNDKRHQILEDIKQINTLLENNKKKIASLSAQLKNSGNTIKDLQIRIASLETTVKQYETDITQLKETLALKDFEIGQLNNKMTALETTVTEKDAQISNQTVKMNEAFFTSGTYRELKDKGIVSKEGGFLGIGRKESLVGNINDNLFSKVDVREIKTIPINSKNVKLITEHPANSYALIPEGDNKIAYLEITNPDQFWKISKYAVVEIIK
jgi:predicted Zn-ribbon and HTH transcriptional regulator